MRVLRKQGRPFLLLPAQRGPAAAALGLYPAQTAQARAARALLRGLLRAGLPAGTEAVSLTISPSDPFVRFLGSLTGVAQSELPAFGVLAGNPASPGQRFIVLLFDQNSRPAAVVKAGVSDAAKALVVKEQSFLETVSGKAAGLPKLRGSLQTPALRALALDYFDGQSPRPRHDGGLLALLRPWVDTKRTVTLSYTPDWRRLDQAAAASPLWPALSVRLRARALHPALSHGDLAPWNIRLSPAGSWTVLDWERGELTGIAGWDWFHYVIQRAILVERAPVPGLVERVEQLLGSDDFKRYAEHTGIAGFARELVLAYLLHSVLVLQPAEGLAQTRALVEALAGKWRLMHNGHGHGDVVLSTA